MIKGRCEKKTQRNQRYQPSPANSFGSHLFNADFLREAPEASMAPWFVDAVRPQLMQLRGIKTAPLDFKVERLSGLRHQVSPIAKYASQISVCHLRVSCFKYLFAHTT